MRVEQQIRIADDGGEHIVKVMRDAARQLADGLHLLTLGKAFLQRALLGHFQRENIGTALALEVFCGRKEEPGRTVFRAFQRGINRFNFAFSGDGSGQCLKYFGAVTFGNSRQQGPCRGIGQRFHRGGNHLHEGGICLEDGAAIANGGDGHRRGVEKSGKAHFGNPDIFFAVFACGTVDHQGAGGAGAVVLAKSDTVQQTHRQRLTVAAFEVEVELLGFDVPGPTADRADQRRAVTGDNIRQAEPARTNLRQIIVEPSRQGGVEIGDATIRLSREEARRGMVQKINGVLKLLKNILVPLALAGGVGNGPQGEGFAGTALQRTRAQAIPAKSAIVGQAGRKAHLFRTALVFTRCLRQTVNRLGHFRRA